MKSRNVIHAVAHQAEALPRTVRYLGMSCADSGTVAAAQTQAVYNLCTCGHRPPDLTTPLPAKAKRGTESGLLLRGCAAAGVRGLLCAGETCWFLKGADPIFIGLVSLLVAQETYSVQKYVKHLQDTLDLLYEEVSAGAPLASSAPGKHGDAFLASERLSVVPHEVVFPAPEPATPQHRVSTALLERALPGELCVSPSTAQRCRRRRWPDQRSTASFTPGTSRTAAFSLCGGIVFRDSLCLVVPIPAAPKGLCQCGGDAGDVWTAPDRSKLSGVRFGSEVGQPNRSCLGRDIL